MKPTRRTLTVAAAILAVVGAGTGLTASTAAASSSPNIYTGELVVCWTTSSNHTPTVWRAPYTCPTNWQAEVAGIGTGTAGPRGPAGPPGPAGPQGPSGVVSAGTHDLGGVASVPTGGPFATSATQVGTITLPAGTYLVTLNAKVTPPVGGTGTVEVFPNLFLYDTAANPSFTGDLLNICNGPLESGANSQIDGYCSGTTLITLAAPTTLHVYAFGYDSDRGPGHYILDDASLTAVQVTPAS